MKRIFLSTVMSFFFANLFAQNNQLFLKTDSKGMHVEHTVTAKENFYSLGRLYNVHPKELAAYNELDMTKGLSIGQKIQVPLTQGNFLQSGSEGTPIYYKVGEKEGLYRVSLNNNKVLMENLRNWNKLSSDKLTPGTRLIVGWLTPGESQNEVVKSEVKLDEKKPTAQVEQKIKEDAIVHEEKPNIATKDDTNSVNPVGSNDDGYFKLHFDQQVKSFPVSKDQTITSGIFRTNSGLQDRKYYALIDKVEPGTIIRVVNPENNKSVYAKVLGAMSGIRQNKGLNLRISNTAATALNVRETDKFIVKVNY